MVLVTSPIEQLFDEVQPWKKAVTGDDELEFIALTSASATEVAVLPSPQLAEKDTPFTVT